MRKPPITDLQALQWSFKFVSDSIDRWIEKYELFQRLAEKETDPAMRAACVVKGNAFMQCAYELKDMYFALRVMTKDEKPIPPKLKLVIDNADGADKAG